MSKEKRMVPELRFPEFGGEWKHLRLSDVTTRVTRKNKNLETDLPLTISAEYGLVDQSDFFNRYVASRDMSGYYLLKKGEFAYNKSYSNGNPWGVVRRLTKYDQGALSSLYICFSANGGFDPDFIEKYFQSNVWHKEVSMIAVEGARNHGLLNVSVNEFFETLHYLPSYNEQKKIATFLSLIDKKIELLEKKAELLEEQKRGLLQQVFSQEIRFKKEDGSEFGEWEEKKVFEVLKYEQPSKYLVQNTAYSDNFDIPVLTANKSFILGYTKETDGVYDKKNAVIFDDFTMDFKYVDFPFKIKSSAIKILTAKENNDILFIYYLFSCYKFIKSGHQRHYISYVNHLMILVPSYVEQVAIAVFFRKQDLLIELITNKLVSMKKLKIGFLQRMFI